MRRLAAIIQCVTGEAISVSESLHFVDTLWQSRYKVIFEPQKTVAAKVGMVVEKSTGGRWRFELRLEATQPDVDGSVTIHAAPGHSALGPVMLYSPTNQPQPFTCHFTHDSSISFDVCPSEVGSGLICLHPGHTG